MKSLKICLYMQGNREWIGGIEYTKNMILALSSLPADVQVTFELSLLSLRTVDRFLYDDAVPKVKNLFFTDTLTAPSLPERMYRLIDRALTGTNDYRYHLFFRDQHFDFVYPFHFGRHLAGPYRMAGWIPDFQHKHLPHFFSEEEIRKRDTRFTQIATYSPTVILSSRTAEADFRTHYPGFAHKTRVLTFKTSPDPSWYEPDPLETQRRYSLPDTFFIVCNQFWKHKNHMTIFQAMRRLREQSINPVLVCTGNIEDHRDRSYMEHIYKTIDEFGIRDQVYILGLIPRIDQIQLIRRSIAVLQPSLFEGWSTVVEDSRCMGKHILLSDISVHKEQNPPHCVFFRPESPEELAGHMAQWWERLSPGPDPDEESRARQSAVDAVRDYGYRILDIARGAS